MKQLSLLTDDQWFDMLLKSIYSRNVDGFEFPAFPAEKLQSQFVGSSNESAMREGFEFFRLVKSYSVALAKPFGKTTKMLDFGCGWGRYLRIFQKDIGIGNLFGVDIDPTILEECKKNRVLGELSRIFPEGKLPYPDAFFDCIIAYSVFTHLPESIHKHWVKEIARVSKPGCVFVLTLEPLRFLDFISDIDAENPPTGWHAGLSRFAGEIPAFKKAYDQGKFVYMPTGGGDYRSSDVYGDAVVSQKFVKDSWGELFNTIDYIDDPARFWQAILITQRP